MNFKDLRLIEPICKALEIAGYKHPTEIQQKAIPELLLGKDLLGCAQTGTGKTAAFALPIIQKIQSQPTNKHIKALILTPTRELALQIEKNFIDYSSLLKIKTLAIFGGVPQGRQVSAIKAGVDILIATPGRLLDLMSQRIVDITKVQFFVLDEADHMLDIGFINDIKKIILKIPIQRQTLLFSATMPKVIKKLANEILNNPLEVSVTPVSSTAETVKQLLFMVEKGEKSDLLIHLLKQRKNRQALIFTRTKHGADKLVKKLSKSRLSAAAIHGDKSQNARQRALADFKENEISVLVATDIAARGIDINELPIVVNYELPDVPETYVHRIGRTGRAGNVGLAISFCDNDQSGQLKDIQKLIGFKIPISAEIKNGRDIMNFTKKI